MNSMETDFKKVAEILKSEFGLKSLRGLSNSEVGQAREKLIKKFLSDYLPSTWHPESGFIRDSVGHRSKQIDVIINDDSILKPLPYDSGKGLFFVESVGVAIAVKSVLDKQQLRDAAENLMSVKKLRRAYPDGTKRILGNYERRIADIVPCFIFGFATRTTVSTLMKNLRAYNEERDIPPEEQIEGIFTLDDG